MRHNPRHAGTTLWEIIAITATTVLLAAAVFTATREARRQASLGDNFANLKQISHGYAAYAVDHAERVCTFSWQAGPSPIPGWPPTSSDLEAARAQGWEILLRRAGRTEIISPPSGWMPHILYSQLVLADYLDMALPARFLAAPEDRLRLHWQAAIEAGTQAYLAIPTDQRPAGGNFGSDLRWPYSSSYELAPAFFAPDARSLSPSYSTVDQSTAGHSFFFTGSTNLPMGRRRLDEVAFPSHKIMIFEPFQRHFGQAHLYFTYPSARVAALFTDGAAGVVTSTSANNGFQPNNPGSLAPTFIDYTPALWEPPAPSGLSTNYRGRYRWTRSGLRGRDFSGPEIPWVD